jgi:type II secretory pathway pseudopilin PulG
MTREKSPIAKPSSHGFTVVEIATVMLLSSLMLAGSLGIIKSWMNKTGTTATQQRLITIQQTLANYQTQYNKLPCPAPFVALNGAGFGRGTCAGGGPILIGALPVRDLGLSDSYSANDGGYMYTYAVTQIETTKLNGLKGAINIVDGAGTSILPVTPAGATVGATYVVVDHGADGKGAHLLSTGAVGIPCAGPGKDVPNCNGAGTFVSAQYSKNAASWYDDAIIYDTGPSSTGPTQQVCTTVLSKASAGGSSGGWNEEGADAGSGVAVGIEGPFIIWFHDVFSLAPSIPAYNTTSPAADAYCPYTNQYVLAGGCTNIKVGAPYGLDINAGTDEQIVMPALSHPALPDAKGKQGWECNGSSALGMQTQAYAICCSGG